MQVAQLVAKVAEDSEERFASLFQQHYKGIVSLLCRLLGSREEAEEQTQEAFLKLARDPVIHRPDTEVLAWLRRVSLNQGYNAVRSHKRESERLQRNARLEEPLGSADSDPETRALRTEEIERVRAVLAKLSRNHQACLLLRHSGLSYKEVAAALGVAPSSIGTLLARAEGSFREHYQGLRQGG